MSKLGEIGTLWIRAGLSGLDLLCLNFVADRRRRMTLFSDSEIGGRPKPRKTLDEMPRFIGDEYPMRCRSICGGGAFGQSRPSMTGRPGPIPMSWACWPNTVPISRQLRI